MIQPPVRSGRRVFLLLVLATGCAHDAPLDYRPPIIRDPFEIAEPVRLTLSGQMDQYPAWRADGSGLQYSFANADGDRCIGVMPPTGGQVFRFRCPAGDPTNDSINTATQSTPRSSDVMAWVEHQVVRGREVPATGAIMLGRFGDPVARPLTAFPVRASTGSMHLTAGYLHWLPQRRLAYVGTDLFILATCTNCGRDTIQVGREAMLIDTRTPNSTPVPIPGTEEASGLWPTADSTGIYFTVSGDTRVWRHRFGSMTPEVVHTFDEIVRDVSVVGDRLAAIVGGEVSYAFESQYPGFIQLDQGGPIILVDLTTGTATALPSEMRFRRPVLSPDGSSLVAEGIADGQTDSNLWLFHLP